MEVKSTWAWAHKCPICDNLVGFAGNFGESTCKCGVVYEYEEGARATDDSLRELAKGWGRPIPVAERLPPMGELVLLFDLDGAPNGWEIGQLAAMDELEDGRLEFHFSDGTGAVNYNNKSRVTHWLPMPPAPELEQ